LPSVSPFFNPVTINTRKKWRSAGGNALEGKGYEFMTGDGDTNDKSIWEVQISARVADATEILLSLTTVKNVMVSMYEDS
jgi:hypothetical protein